jgi:spore maturation protein CgeB
MIDAIVNSGLRIALVGRGWQSYFGMRDNVTYFDAMTHREITKLYQDTKVVVNVNAVNGASERLFDAIDSGAMVYSEFSMMLYDMFGSGNGVLFHNINAQESSITLLTNIIKRNETESWALSAKESVRSAHTWKHRAIYLNQLVNAFSLA